MDNLLQRREQLSKTLQTLTSTRADIMGLYNCERVDNSVISCCISGVCFLFSLLSLKLSTRFIVANSTHNANRIHLIKEIREAFRLTNSKSNGDWLFIVSAFAIPVLLSFWRLDSLIWLFNSAEHQKICPISWVSIWLFPLKFLWRLTANISPVFSTEVVWICLQGILSIYSALVVRFYTEIRRGSSIERENTLFARVLADILLYKAYIEKSSYGPEVRNQEPWMERIKSANETVDNRTMRRSSSF